MGDLSTAHSSAFRFRRFLNWFPLGISYALLYMGRYNLTVSKNALGDLMSKAAFGEIFGLGATVYAFAFLINGPLTDKIGGKKSMLIGMGGTILANLLMGGYLYSILNAAARPDPARLQLVFSVLYALNMYFQSYGAVAIVKTNAPWFHVRERGTFGGIFGIMISSGLFFAFDVNQRILDHAPTVAATGGQAVWWVFFAPAALLGVFWALNFLFLCNKPSEAGFKDFELGDASSGEDDVQPPVLIILKRVLTNPVILTIAFVEMCTGITRNGIMQWYPIFAKENLARGITTGFKYTLDNWGLIQMIAGVTGGVFAGWVSDRFFNSRRAPSAGLLYVTMTVCTVFMLFCLENGWTLSLLTFLMSICVIGTHGMLSGTATMDFGGRKGAGTAVGIIDGFVYLGTAIQAFAIGHITSSPALGWNYWPLFMLPFGIIGTVLLTRIWHVLPQPVKRAAPEVQAVNTDV
ncbi:MAG: MFS transporter [Elusimicrobiaceae bacterium]|nr:MFS transporter [Elusimicrobiaceae bacterium]